MKPDRIRLAEHLALQSNLTLQEFCALLQERIALPPFKFDAENETEWGYIEIDHTELNVSRPYDAGTLHRWDSTVPPECTFGITLEVARDHPSCSGPEWSLNTLVPQYGQEIANIFRTTVFYHRTWLGPGQNIERHKVYVPADN